jgi:hypothetical protein
MPWNSHSFKKMRGIVIPKAIKYFQKNKKIKKKTLFFSNPNFFFFFKKKKTKTPRVAKAQDHPLEFCCGCLGVVGHPQNASSFYFYLKKKVNILVILVHFK